MKKLGITLLAALSLCSQPICSPAADAPDMVPSEQPASEQKTDAPALPTVLPNVPKPAPTPLELQVGGLEQKFFGEIFDKEPVSRRMDRLERFAYGATTHGTDESRIDALRAAMSKPLPDGTKGADLPVMTAPTPPPAAAAESTMATASTTAPELTSFTPPAAAPPGEDSKTSAPPAAAQPNNAASKPENTSMLATSMAMPSQPIPVPVLQSGIQRDVPSQVERAAQTLATAAAPHPTPAAPLHLSLSGLIVKVDDPKRTMQALADTLDSDPVFSAELFYQRAQVELGLKDYKGALKDLTDAILKEPMRYKYYLARAVVYQKLGNPFMAAKDVATARYANRDLPDQVEFDADTKSATR